MINPLTVVRLEPIPLLVPQVQLVDYSRMEDGWRLLDQLERLPNMQADLRRGTSGYVHDCPNTL